MAPPKSAAPDNSDASAMNDHARHTSFYIVARMQLVCAKCKTTKAWQAHHVVQQQRLRREGVLENDSDNALRLCSGRADSCHERHTTGQERVPLSCLHDANFFFAARSLGPGPAYVYLRAQYAGDDPRLEALLDEAAGRDE